MKPTTMSKIALDSNVLIYRHSSDDITKKEQAIVLTTNPNIVSGQVLSEYLNVLHRRMKISKEEVFAGLPIWLRFSTIVPVTKDTIVLAGALVKRYDFQMFDSIVVATAVEADCDTLYTEDMQHNLLVDGRLRIINPFL